MNCRHCRQPLVLPFVDLATAPPSNAYLTKDALRSEERHYPLRVLVCTNCWLVQTEDLLESTALFGPEYAYFSSVSASWVAHAERFVASAISRFGLNAKSHVVEVASNDGYLLQFVKKSGVPCTGIEPTAGTAAAARQRGITVVEEFFGLETASRLASRGAEADLLIANNVLAHVPDINDFIAGAAALLKPHGAASFEFPHLLRLVDGVQFDTIYHEHYSYLSLTAVERVFLDNGLAIFDVEELPTHGGSLRVYAQRKDSGARQRSSRVDELLSVEMSAGLPTPQYYAPFQQRAERIKDDFLRFLLEAKARDKSVVGYGAAAKGNTLLNFAGVRSDLISFVADRSTSKQGKFLPGSRIPVVAEELIRREKPDYIVLFPWNLRTELFEQLSYARGWGAKFVTAVPGLAVT